MEIKRLEGPPSAGASHTPAANGISVAPMDNPSSAGGQGTIGTNLTENTRANTDANSTGGGTGT